VLIRRLLTQGGITSLDAPQMHRDADPQRTIPLFAIAVGFIELAIGVVAVTSPAAFNAPVYAEALVTLPRYGMVFAAGGVVLLLVSSRQGLWASSSSILIAGLGALPLLAASALSLVRVGLWPAPIAGILVGVGAVLDVVLSLRPSAGRLIRAPMMSIAAAVGALALSAAVFALPESLRVPSSSLVGPARMPLVLAGTAALLVAGWVISRFRIASQVLAGILLVTLAVASGMVGRWVGTIAFGILAVFLAAEPAFTAALQRRIAQRATQPRAVTDYEVATEVAAWGFAFMTILAGAVEDASEARGALAALALATSLFTFFWFHVRSAQQARLPQTVAGSAVYSLLVALLVTVTGGAGSPYFFVYTLPIVALAWTHAPQAILVPLAIPLAALLTEALTGFRAIGGLQALAFALPRIGGLLLVAGFAYMLARRNLEEQDRIRTSHLRLQTVLAAMGEALIATDAQGHIILCNNAARTLLRDADVSGRPVADAMKLRRLDGTAIGRAEHPLQRALAGERVSSERVLVSSPQSAVPVALSAAPLPDGHGGAGAILLLRTIGAELEMERVRDDFFFIASHELRTPLTIMKGNLELAQEAAPPGGLRTAIDEALGSVTRLMRMVNDFLDAARLEHGTLSTRLEDGYLPDLVRQAIQTIRPDAERKGLELVYREGGGVPAVRMDVERALQILLNLLGNSVRYTTAGRIEVWHEARDGAVETYVRDTGPGIPPEGHARLFTRFGQVERGLTRPSASSGLGLYISRRLAEQMGGTVVLVHSAPGQGSTFALRLAMAGSAGR
jgi:signal transduction histidine kinase